MGERGGALLPADSERVANAIQQALNRPFSDGVVVDHEAGVVRIARTDADPYVVRIEHGPGGEHEVLRSDGRHIVPVVVERHAGRDETVLRVSDGASEDEIRRGIAGSVEYLRATVGDPVDGVRTDSTPMLEEGSRSTQLGARDVSRVAQLRVISDDLREVDRQLTEARSTGDERGAEVLSARQEQLQADLRGRLIDYGLAEWEPSHAPHALGDNRPIVGPAAARQRIDAIREFLGDSDPHLAAHLDGVRDAPASEPDHDQQIRAIRTEIRDAMRAGAEKLMRQRDLADGALTERVKASLATGPNRVFDRLILGGGWAATLDYHGLGAVGDFGDGIPGTMCVSEGHDPWASRGELAMGQVPNELALGDLPFQPAHFAERGSDFASSADFAAAVGASRAADGMPTFRGEATEIEARPADAEVRGWPPSAKYRVKVDDHYLYAENVDVASGPGPARALPVGHNHEGRFVDPASGVSTHGDVVRAADGRQLTSEEVADLPRLVRQNLGLENGQQGPLIADSAGRLVDPRVVDRHTGVAVDAGTGELYGPDGRRLDANQVTPEALQRLGFDSQGRFSDPRWVPDREGYAVHPTTGQVAVRDETGNGWRPVDPRDLTAATRDRLDDLLRSHRVQSGGQNLSADYHPDDRVLIVGAGAAGAWDIEQAAGSHASEVHWVAREDTNTVNEYQRGLREEFDDPATSEERRAWLARELSFSGGYNRRNTLPEVGAYSPEVLERVSRSAELPTNVQQGTDGRFVVRFPDGRLEPYDRVVVSIGQDATGVGGVHDLVKGFEIGPIYGRGGGINGYQDHEGGLRILGAASTAGPIRAKAIEGLPDDESRDALRSIMAKQLNDLPFDSAGVPPAIRYHAGRIAAVNRD